MLEIMKAYLQNWGHHHISTLPVMSEFIVILIAIDG